LSYNTTYLLTGLPIAIVSFVVVLVGLVLGLSLFMFGLPILGAVMLSARMFADLERLRIRRVLGIQLIRPTYRTLGPEAAWWRRQMIKACDLQSWLDAAFSILMLPVSIITWTLAVVWWSIGLAGITWVLYGWSIPHEPNDNDLPALLGFENSDGGRLLVYTGLGVVFLATLPLAIRLLAVCQASFSRAMITGVAEVRERIRSLEAERSTAQEQTVTAQARTVAAVSAETTALRRLERDIHDGPQQRLVRLALDLSRAQHQLDQADADAAKQTMSEAIAQAKETLEELRALSRGIAPPILVDRGLVAAITALAGRSTVPVDLINNEIGRLESTVESTTYFVIAEALTNIAKHSQATECRIQVQRAEQSMFVVVSDNGIGGASLAKGHGLAGLNDRVQAAGGKLTVVSVVDSGTVITAELPL
jgi:signal transduction histidine kinase